MVAGMIWERRSQCAQWHTGVAIRLGSGLGNCGWRWGSTQSLQLQDMGTFLCRTIRGLQATAAHDIRLNHFMSNNANSWEVIRNQQKADYNQGLEHPINRQICKYFFFSWQKCFGWLLTFFPKCFLFLSSFYYSRENVPFFSLALAKSLVLEKF